MKERQIPDQITCTVPQAAVWRNSENFFLGRVLKLFSYRKKILLQLIRNGKKYKAHIEEGVADHYAELAAALQIGDIICGMGMAEVNRYGEAETAIQEAYIIKACQLRPVETGLQTEGMYSLNKRKEYYHTYLATDQICAMRVFIQDQILTTLRQILREKGYVECPTPILQNYFYGGGARPFITHRVDSGNDVYLRLTSEIALKQYIAGSFEKVYEIGHSFRNGNTSAKYLTPFMAAEIYTAYGGEEENILLMQEIFMRMVTDTKKIMEEFQFSEPEYISDTIPVISFSEFFQCMTGMVYHRESPEVMELIQGTADKSLSVKEVYKFFKQKLIPRQSAPIIVTDLPGGMSPLIQWKDEEFLYRSYLIVNGATLMEAAIGKSDVKELEKELNRQAEEEDGRKIKRNYEAFLHANAMGIPETASLFISLDRIFPALCGIEDVGVYHMKM